MKRKCLALCLVLFLLPWMTSCGKERKPLEITDEEAQAVLEELVPASYEINEIFFGVGLPYEGETEEEEESTTDTEIDFDDGASLITTSYLPVTEDCGYASIREIKAAAQAVYSMGYLESVYVTMFEGMAATSEDGLLNNNVSPRYKELAGILCVDALHEPLAIRGRLTVLSSEVVKKTPDYVSVSCLCRNEAGEESQETFLLTLENGVWLLDGPTY